MREAKLTQFKGLCCWGEKKKEKKRKKDSSSQAVFVINNFKLDVFDRLKGPT